jgi:hypothetical protein
MATAPNPETTGEEIGLLNVARASIRFTTSLTTSGNDRDAGLWDCPCHWSHLLRVHLLSDLSTVHSTSIMPYVLLGIALLVALGFEFVNGFHDTANAVATVIYTHSLEPHIAVVWSGFWNFLGVLTSSGLVAFGIISLLPVELILQVGSKAGFAMVFALLVAAIIWNLGTWYFGLPASSSHTMIGSIIGVGIANQLMSPKTGTSGVDWGQATNIGSRCCCRRSWDLSVRFCCCG